MSEGGDSLNTPVVQPQLRALMLPLPLPGAKGEDATFVFSTHTILGKLRMVHGLGFC